MEALLHWPWWVGSTVLALLTVGSYFWVGHPLGVSRHWGLLVRGPRKEEELLHDPIALQAALLEATRAEFGDDIDCEAIEEEPPKAMLHESFASAIVFLLMLAVGGFLGALFRGDLQWHTEMGQSFQASFGDGFGSWLVLLLGGTFIGFGVRLAGGCPSGHGLSGCSRLSLASFIAVASFFIGGIAVSFLLRALS
jgi:hypothetical protein